jgi:hypothetical protein
MFMAVHTVIQCSPTCPRKEAPPRQLSRLLGWPPQWQANSSGGGKSAGTDSQTGTASIVSLAVVLIAAGSFSIPPPLFQRPPPASPSAVPEAERQAMRRGEANESNSHAPTGTARANSTVCFSSCRWLSLSRCSYLLPASCLLRPLPLSSSVGETE